MGSSKLSQRDFEFGAHWIPIRTFLNRLAGVPTDLETSHPLKLQYSTLGKPGVSFLSKVATTPKLPDPPTLATLNNMRSPKRPKTDTSLASRQAKRRVAFLVLWYQGESKYSQKVFCHNTRPNVWGFPGGFTNYLESFPKSLSRIVSRDCVFGSTFGNWVQHRLSNPSAEHMTCLTKDNFVPTKKPDARYTIRMYALKVPLNLLVNGRGPKI